MTSGVATRAEIFQQPELWLDTWKRATAAGLDTSGPVVLTGAGTSAYAAASIAVAWRDSRAVATTDLLTEPPLFADDALLISIARSGDSPESVGVVERVRRFCPWVRHLAITCNAAGRLAQLPGMELLLLDPRTNDRSLAMTSSFSNLVLAGLSLPARARLAPRLDALSNAAERNLPGLDRLAHALAQTPVSRVLVLASPPLLPAAREASLKITEMSAGGIIAIPETYLGLRHGPMAFLQSDALIVCFHSSDPVRRRYEGDLLRELKAKQLGRIVAIADPGDPPDSIDELVPANAPRLSDELRTPFEIVFPQLLAYHLSLRSGLDPDSPSPAGVISRVVQGVTVYGEEARV